MEISIFLGISLDRTSFSVNGNFKPKIIYTVLDLLFPGTAAKNATIGFLASNQSCDPAIPIMWSVQNIRTLLINNLDVFEVFKVKQGYFP
jgi:hypothetical protein